MFERFRPVLQFFLKILVGKKKSENLYNIVKKLKICI